MATIPDEPQPKPSRPARLARKVAEPVSTPKRRRAALLAAAAALAATAPFPFGPIGAALVVLIALGEK